MNSPIEKTSALHKENLNKSQYTISLLNEAVACGLLSGAKFEEIQLQIMQVLQERMIRYTYGESTSVSAETAQSLLAGVLYCVDAALLELPCPDDALAFVVNTSIAEVYAQGSELVKRTVKQTKGELQELLRNRLSIELEAYQSTVNHALPDFFASFDPDFFPHEAAGLIDYPLLFDDSGRTSVFYIQDFIRELKTETLFCRYFTEEALSELLTSYGRTYHTDYRALLINIVEVLLNNCLFSVLLGHEPSRLFLTNDECYALTSKWKGYNAGQIELLLHAAIEQIICQMKIEDASLLALLRRYPPEYAPRVVHAVKMSTLHHIVIVRQEAQQPALQFQEGEKLSDDAIRMAVQKILACTSAADKVLFIHTEIHAFEDLLDILSSECLFETEYNALFNAFGDAELALLCFNMLENEMYIDDMDIILAQLTEVKPENEWQYSLVSYLSHLDFDRLSAILRYAKSFSDSTE